MANISIVLASQNDDGVITEGGWYNPTGGGNVLGWSGVGQWSSWRRFILNIPKNSTISSAYIEMQNRTTKAEIPVNSIINGELVDDAQYPTSFADYKAKTRTSSSVNWSVTDTWVADSIIQTPDIKDIIQEIVNQENFAAGNYIQIFIDYDDNLDDKHYRSIYSYEDYPAILHINYEPPIVPQIATSRVSQNITLETYDHSEIQHIISDASSIKFSNHYSDEGSGFGYLSFSLNRKSGINYSDIGHGYEIKLRKNIKQILFDGIITKIDEGSNDTLEISAVGLNTLLSFDITNFVLSDQRTNRWVAGCTARGSYRPDKFDHSLNWTEIINEGAPEEEEIPYDGIEITPRRGMSYNNGDYYYIRYRFEFNETASKIVFNYKAQLTNNWPGKIEILDSEENSLWSKDVSANGSEVIDLTTYTNGNFVELRFTVTASGDNTAEDGTVYFRMWDIIVYSTTDLVSATKVANFIAEYMHTNFNFSSDYSLIETINYEIPQAAYDNDEALDLIMKDACRYGDGNGKPLAWGVYYDDSKRMFLEIQDTSEIKYKLVESEDYTVSGDLADSYQKVYGKYTNTYGQTVRTADQTASDQIEALGGLYKRQVIELDEVTSDQASTALELALNENKEPKISTSFTISDFILGQNDSIIPIEDIISGSMIQVPQFRARETNILDDKRMGYFSFMLKSVEIDLDNRTAVLTPADARSTFEKYIENIKRMNNR
jgi:hypothetical protein